MQAFLRVKLLQKIMLTAFQNICDGYPKHILSLDFDTKNINGIKKINIIDWLLN